MSDISPELNQGPPRKDQIRSGKNANKSIKSRLKNVAGKVILGTPAAGVILSSGNVDNPNIHAPNIKEPTPASVSLPENTSQNTDMLQPYTYASESDNPETTQQLSIQDFEKRAEQLYQIQIAFPHEGIVTLADGTEVKPNEWTKDQIADLTKVLDKLPPHFYLPGPKVVIVHLPSLSGAWGYAIDPSKDIKQQEKEWEAKEQQIKKQNDIDDIAELKKFLGDDYHISKHDLEKARKEGYFKKIIEGALPVRFTIVNTLPMDVKDGKVVSFHEGQCYCSISNENPEILFTPFVFKADFSVVFSTVVHELTHRISKQEDYKFISELLEIPENINFGDFVYNNAYLSDSKNYSALKDAGFRAWAEKDKYYYGTQNANEYISVASEFYIGGRERFVKIYSIFIGEEKANRLYKYMRDKIFRGREYERKQ